MSWVTRRWAIDQCLAYFGLNDTNFASIGGARGREFLMALWEKDPAVFYEHPLQILRQEWFHGANAEYPCPGFWIALAPTAVVLDYGCGTAEVARLPWICRGGAIDCYETSHLCRGYLHTKYRDYPQVRILNPQAPLDTTYDALICTDVLEHLPDPLDTTKRLWALLKPGGHALLHFEIMFPHPGHLYKSILHYAEWKAWINAEAEIIEQERYLWVRKPS